MIIRKYEYIRCNNHIHYNHLIVMSMIIMYTCVYTFIITTLVIVRSINKRMYESFFLYIDGMNTRTMSHALILHFISVI